MHKKAPGWFKFTLKDNHEFNFLIYINVFYLDGQPVLHLIDSATAFGAARFLKDISARTTWNTLRACWIDTYLGPPDMIIHDAGKNFASLEFWKIAKTMAINTKEVPVEAYNSIGKVERYHAPLRRCYKIISNKLKDKKVNKDIVL